MRYKLHVHVNKTCKKISVVFWSRVRLPTVAPNCLDIDVYRVLKILKIPPQLFLQLSHICILSVTRDFITSYMFLLQRNRDLGQLMFSSEEKLELRSSKLFLSYSAQGTITSAASPSFLLTSDSTSNKCSSFPCGARSRMKSARRTTYSTLCPDFPRVPTISEATFSEVVGPRYMEFWGVAA